MKRNHTNRILAIAALGAVTAVAIADTNVTFDNGDEGWTGPSGTGGATFIDGTGGNPGAHMHTVFNNFGITFFNSSDADFVADYTEADSVTMSIDVKVDDIGFFGTPVSRPWLLELRDFDSAQGGYPWTSVWYKFADISAAAHGDWTTFSVTIDDTGATALPSGWGGYGDETPLAEPILPPGVTFQDVLAGVDEVAFTTFEPGFFFGFTDFDVRIDNLSIQTTGGTPPCPTDVDGSGGTDVDDLVQIILDWGICVDCPTDLTGDNRVTVDDLIEVILGWGACPTK